MIVRLWHGWTTPATGDAYEHLLEEGSFAGAGLTVAIKRSVPSAGLPTQF